MIWNFDNIPLQTKNEIKELYTQNQLNDIIKIYNLNRVSPELITPCCGGLEEVKKWTEWAIANKKL